MIPGSLEGLDISIADMWKKHRERVKALSKHSFAGWIIYQIVKGTLTTTFIWAPMIYYYFAK